MLRVTQKEGLGVDSGAWLNDWVCGQRECHTLMWETHEGWVEKVDKGFCSGHREFQAFLGRT